MTGPQPITAAEPQRSLVAEAEMSTLGEPGPSAVAEPGPSAPGEPRPGTTGQRVPIVPEEPEMSKAERRLYVSFFENLGISDDKQTVFLAALLRNVFEASSKLDSHLAPHGASLHSAVSRMQVSDNPREAPTHRWIRVVDRLGFFSDSNAHAERIVNVGLSFAYRHMEVDALAEANAILLGNVQTTADQTTDGDEIVVLPRGGVDVTPMGGGTSAGAGAGAGASAGAGAGGVAGVDATGDDKDGLPPIDEPMQREEEGEESALPEGGMSFPNLSPPFALGAANAGGRSGGPSASVVTSVNATTATDGAPAAEAAGAAEGQETPLPTGGIEFQLDGANPLANFPQDKSGAAADAEIGARGGAAPAGAAPSMEGSIDADEEEEDDGGSSASPPHVIHDRQPTVVPTSFALETVKAVLTGLQDRIDGMAVLRQLLDDSVLVLGRSSSRPALKSNGKLFPKGIRGDRMALGLRTDGWWPQWRAPDGLPKANSVPPAGTVAHTFNRHRQCVASRWVILVDMKGINDTIAGLSVRSARFFPKNALVPFEMVPRIWGRAPMRLPVVVACMLLLATKEEDFGTTLAQLASAGRATVPKHASLLSASCHEFNTSGISAPVAPDCPPGASSDLHASQSLSQTNPAPPNDQPVDLSQQYAEMEVALDNEDTAIKKNNRAARVRARNAKAYTHATPRGASTSPAVAPSSSAGGSASVRAAAPPSGTSTATLSRSSRRPPARSRAQAAGALPPRPIDKRARAASSKGAVVKRSKRPAPASAGAAAGTGAAGASSSGAGGGAPTHGGVGVSNAAAAGAEVCGHPGLVRLVVAPAVTAALSADAGVPPLQAAGALAGIAGAPAPLGAMPTPSGPPTAGATAVAGTRPRSAPAPINPSAVHGGFNGAAAPPDQSFPSLHTFHSLPPLANSSALRTGTPSEGGADALGLALPHVRSASEFREEQRLRHARVNADLADAHASVLDLLSSRHKS